MSETGDRLRRLFEEIAPPVDVRGAMASRAAVVGVRRGWLIAGAAAGAVLLLGFAGWLLAVRRGAEPPVITGPPVTTSTTSVSTTTASPRFGWGLDALTAFQGRPVGPAATCPAGSTPDEAGDPEAPRPVEETLEGDSSVAFDRQSGLLVEVLVNREPSEGFSYSTWTFDPCRNRWREMQSIGFDPTWYLSPITYDADSDRVVTIDYLGTVWAYDTDADTWTSTAWTVGESQLPIQWRGVYHAPSGLIVLYDSWPSPGVSGWAYDVDTGRRYELAPWVGPPGEVIYDSAGDRFYVFPSQTMEVVRWEPGEGWQPLGIPAPEALFNSPACGLFDLQGGPVVFDEATARVVAFCRGTAVAAFDPATLAWEVLVESGADLPGSPAATAVYDSANGRLILVGGYFEGVGGAMWAYNGRTGDWTELLAAVE